MRCNMTYSTIILLKKITIIKLPYFYLFKLINIKPISPLWRESTSHRCEGDPLATTDGFPSQRPVTWSFDVFFYMPLNNQFSKQPRCRWFETSSPSLWRHYNRMKITECTIDASASDKHRTFRTVRNERGAIFFQHNQRRHFLLRSHTGVGLLMLWSLFSPWSKILILPKYQLYHLHHVNICQVSLWIRCNDNSQI